MDNEDINKPIAAVEPNTQGNPSTYIMVDVIEQHRVRYVLELDTAKEAAGAVEAFVKNFQWDGAPAKVLDRLYIGNTMFGYRPIEHEKVLGNIKLNLPADQDVNEAFGKRVNLKQILEGDAHAQEVE